MAIWIKKGYVKVRGTYNPPPIESEPGYGIFGYAKMGNTTGGAGAVDMTIITEGNSSGLKSQLFSGSNASNSKILILEDGVYDTPSNLDPRICWNIETGSNKTIIGMPGAWLKNCSFRIKNGFGNIIFRNIKCSDLMPQAINADGTYPVDSDGDILQSDHIVLLNGASRIWIDHILHVNSAYTDGFIDSASGSDYVTISHCDYPSQDKMSLLGGSSSTTTYNGVGRYTWAYNRLTNVIERGPSFANGFIHHLNNYCLHNTTSLPAYSVQLQLINKAQCYSQSNYFKDLIGKAVSIGNYVAGMPYPGFVDVGNIYDNVTTAISGSANNTGTTFNPYSEANYIVPNQLAANLVPAYVNAHAGNTLTLEEMGITL